ncbi:hypothetical protein UM91_02085 [Pseudomonas oryzihabitans]|nr:hypothetical protein UM91_02085 [Pseudomonas oryzihabitans]
MVGREHTGTGLPIKKCTYSQIRQYPTQTISDLLIAFAPALPSALLVKFAQGCIQRIVALHRLGEGRPAIALQVDITLEVQIQGR